MRRCALWLQAAMLALPLTATAAEGMWTLDNLPVAALKSRYGFAPDAAWIEHVMKASVRLADGCSGSFVSPDGLVMTNAHCVLDCVQGLSHLRDYVNRGFVARSRSAELRCPATELNRLEQIRDVSAQIDAAVRGKSGQAYVEAKRAAQAQLESACVADRADTTRCDVVELYGGARHHLYRYHRFQDLRLVFFPEYQAAFFGGDPDNFNFPRYALDLGLLRAYENGKPAAVDDYFRFRAEGAKPDELTFVTGHPGSTQRQLSVAQLETLRDFRLIQTLLYYAERRAMLAQYSRSGRSAAHFAQTDLTYTENSLKVYRGQLQALADPELLARKRAEEAALRAAAASSEPWEQIARAEAVYRRIAPAYQMLERRRAFYTTYFEIARDLVRGAAERALPNEQRLPEYQDAALPELEQNLFSTAPLRPSFEETKLAWSLAKLRETLGADDARVKLVLRGESPEDLAEKLVDGTRLGSLAERRRLWEGGTEAVTQSQDPFVQLARAVDALSRDLRKQMEAEVEAPEARAAEDIARLRFARDGSSAYPDASFTLRLSYGELRGWEESGEPVPPFTELRGAFARQSGHLPYVLPDSWNAAKARLDLATPLNFVTTNDVVGGNSGSPVINREAEIVGLVFDGNIHSLGGAYTFDERDNRCIAVHPAAIVEALDEIYAASSLKDELLGNDAEK